MLPLHTPSQQHKHSTHVKEECEFGAVLAVSYRVQVPWLGSGWLHGSTSPLAQVIQLLSIISTVSAAFALKTCDSCSYLPLRWWNDNRLASSLAQGVVRGDSPRSVRLVVNELEQLKVGHYRQNRSNLHTLDVY